MSYLPKEPNLSAEIRMIFDRYSCRNAFVVFNNTPPQHVNPIRRSPRLANNDNSPLATKKRSAR